MTEPHELKLLPCPFCGSTPLVSFHAGATSIWCDSDACGLPETYAQPGNLSVDQWNRRFSHTDGVAKPHELEERATVAAVAAWIEWGWSAGGKGMKELPAEAVGAMTRAVLDLVRQEQEKAASLSMIGAAYELDNAPGMLPTAADYYAAMIRAWWLSHTAPQEK